MKNLFLSTALIIAFLPACSETVSVPSGPERVSGEAPGLEARKLAWEELVPEGEEERLLALYQAQLAEARDVEEGGTQDVVAQLKSYTTVNTLEGQRVRLPGYTVPFEYGVDAEISEFLLVPYFGACLHAPAPPPNQTIYVTTTKPIKLVDLAQAVWVEGTLRISKAETELADAAYTIEMEMIEDYVGSRR